MASLDDILTTQKNAVIALNNYNRTIVLGQGTATSSTVSASALVVTGAGRLVSISVVEAGSASGKIHDASTVAGATAANAMAGIPNTVGVHMAGTVFTDGIVVIPGSGQSVCVTYSRE